MSGKPGRLFAVSSGFTWRQRLRYRMDNAFSRGIWVVLLWLGVITLVFFVVIALVIALSGIGPGDESTSFFEGLWLAMTRSLDPGTFSGDEGGRFRIIMLVVTIVGIFIAATIIGLVSSGIDSRVESLRRGRSLVVEEGHTIIIGRSDKLPTVISELVEANLSERDLAIVVLTPDDTLEVTEDVRASVPELKTSRLVVRNGTPTRLHDLSKTNPAGAKSVIVLQGESDSDAHVVKVVLALANLVPGLVGLNVVAEVHDGGTASALRAAVGASLVTVTPKDIIGRTGAQVSRAAGLGAIYQELLDFDGDEIYTTELPAEWVGRNYGELLLASSRATIIGVHRADGSTVVNPPLATVLSGNDRAIGIAEDDSTFVLDRSPHRWEPPTTPRTLADERRQERTLLVGWSELAPLISVEIDSHVASGSELHVMFDPQVHRPEAIRAAVNLEHQALVLHEGDPINRVDLDAAMAGGPFDHIMLLSEREQYSADEADARTLLTLMHAREITLATPHEENIVAELIDPNDVELGGTSSNSDFIVSQKLISLLIAQLAESPHLASVFEDLFDTNGAIISMHPASRYGTIGEVTFADVIRATREWGVTAIGVVSGSTADDSGSLGGGIRVNPPKDQLLRLDSDDVVIVIGRA